MLAPCLRGRRRTIVVAIESLSDFIVSVEEAYP